MIKPVVTFYNKVRRQLDEFYFARREAKFAILPGIRIHHPDHLHTFCGYYDRSPFSPDGSRLLVCCVDAERLEDRLQSARIYIYDLETGHFTLVGSTSCWNFQQGAQQQWISDTEVIFNSVSKDNPVAQIFNVLHQPKLVEEIEGSAGMINRERGLVAVFDYGPLAMYEHDYAYKSLKASTDFAANRAHLRIIIWSIALRRPILMLDPDVLDAIDHDDPGSRDGVRYIQHVKFNPSGTQIIFVLRSASDSRSIPLSSLYACDLASGHITRLIQTVDWAKGCNHPVWADDKNVLVNLFDDSFKARKFTLLNASNAARKIIASRHDGVGHPTICEEEFILTDQYVPKAGQSLVKFPLPSGGRQIIGHFPPAKYPKGADRCDLHPRYDVCSKQVAIDHYSGEGRIVRVLKL